MGGTGKTQVIKALISMFEQRQENHRFIVIMTIVILTQKMRQLKMSEDDKKFRTALSNMRYAACTSDDLEFLETLRANGDKRVKSLSKPNLKNMSIITSLNTQKDQINESSSICFAQEIGQQLTHFFYQQIRKCWFRTEKTSITNTQKSICILQSLN